MRPALIPSLRRAGTSLVLCCAVATLAPAATSAAADAAPFSESAQAARSYSQSELDRLLAPVALYPDALLSQVLAASTYPVQVVQAERWSREHADLSGDAAVNAVADESWDPSVKALVATPHLLATMSEKLDWTESLGQAFLAQPQQVMDTVQNLRRRARAAGNLHSGDGVNVSESASGAVVIASADPAVIYVPYYDPLVVFGAWWWPAFPPVMWAPWPGYYVRVGAGPLVVVIRGPVIRLAPRYRPAAFDWPHRRLVVVHEPVYVRAGEPVRVRPVHRAPVVWRHEPRRHHLVIRDAVPAVRAAPRRPAPVANERHRRVPEHRGGSGADARRGGDREASRDAGYERRREARVEERAAPEEHRGFETRRRGGEREHPR